MATDKPQDLNPTIPVVDMNDWLATGEGADAKKKDFVDAVRQALHEVGFFAVINAGTDGNAIDAAYDAMQNFFSAPLEKKDECHKPEIGGLRGYVHSEMAQGQTRKDHKEHYHIGPIDEDVVEAAAQGTDGTSAGAATDNIFPSWMDMKTPLQGLFTTMNRSRSMLEESLSLAMGEDANFLTSLSTGGSPLLRALHYPSNPEPGHCWGAAHTDINMFTILPRATEEGLQVFMPKCAPLYSPNLKVQPDSFFGEDKEEEGEWIPVQTPANALIINGGDELQALTNGYFRSSIHRIVAKPNVERYSMVYFIHPRNECSVAPRPKSLCPIEGGQPIQALFPQGVTAWEMLRHRLMELGVVPTDWDSSYAKAVGELVKTGRAHPAMLKTWRLWGKMKVRAEKEKEAAKSTSE